MHMKDDSTGDGGGGGCSPQINPAAIKPEIRTRMKKFCSKDLPSANYKSEFLITAGGGAAPPRRCKRFLIRATYA